MVPEVGLEPTRPRDTGFWVQRVYQFRHPGKSIYDWSRLKMR